jgi:phosphate-selective porin OprO and OprP
VCLVPPATDLQAQAPAAASPPPSSALEQQESPYDRIWRAFSEWYDNQANPVVQRVVFSGRYQHDLAVVDAGQGEHDESNVRRMRLGSGIRVFRRVLFHAEGEFNPQEPDPFYVRLTDFYVQWSRGRGLVVTAGKQSVPFTLDGSTSSKELLTIDRNALSNNLWFPEEYIPGVSAAGRRAPWVYRAGVYSAGRRNREFGEFTGGFFTLGVVGYDFARRLGVRQALLTGNYVYQQPDVRNTFTRPLQHVASVNFRLDQPPWGLQTDLSAGAGYLGQSDLWGFVVMPYVSVTGKLQIATRFTFLDSADPNGLRMATYENKVVSGRGDRYRETYLGATYYFYGHRLKLQTGLQYGDMDDRADDGGAYCGVSWTTGIRVGWP